MITQEELKENVHYNQETGMFCWIKEGHKRKLGVPICSKSNGYVLFRVGDNMYPAHRLAWLYVYGYFPEGDIDHIDRKRDNNIFTNLRAVSRSCNLRNSKIRVSNKSGITGVTWREDRKRWLAYVAIDGKQKNLGSFVGKTEAVLARWKAEVKYNYPDCNTTSTAYQYLKENEWFSDSSKIKRCPFWLVSKDIGHNTYTAQKDGFWYVQCTCGARGPVSASEDFAIKSWERSDI